ncbi:disease resistance protein [Actinidia rufa]|uniref:Disease resistance protein n=1 Tax=Actinidia rufa TaxID=165716 RepID=A0A7J0F7H3_9ERIC|nr:disease resistance protein [Actinidia rufa]
MLESSQVFLSFRGKDTRKTFTDHLYTALMQAGFHTFRDDEEIEKGENIESELKRAIEQSRISIIVLSKDYASSRSFAEAFARHEERLKLEMDGREKECMDKVERWRAALREVADLGGMGLQNQADGYESKFIQEIVKEIGNKLNRMILSVARYPIGIDSRVKNINSWLQDGSTDVCILVMYGMGGIGKTTIAKAVYNLNFDKFECSSFISNVRETSEQPNGLIRLQKQLLSNILKGKKEKINNVHEGITKIKDAISYDSLEDYHDKNLFLDIACFFIGKDKNYTVSILEKCGFKTGVGLQNLVNKCLITFDKCNKLMMHQLLRDMGREVIRQESTEEPGKRSRLWHHKDSFTVLNEKTGTETIEGLLLDMDMLKQYNSSRTSFSINNRKRHRVQEYSDNSKLLYQGNFLKKALSGFPQLVPPNQCIIACDGHSHCLTKTPDFSGLPSLERLILKDCIRLVGVHESIGNLVRLVFLNLRGCTNLRNLPGQICMLKSLEELILSDCSKLEKFPDELGRMVSLKVLIADGTKLYLGGNQIRSLPESVKALTTLQSLHLDFCRSLQWLPELPPSLVMLNAEDCRSLEIITNLPNWLRSLNLDLCDCTELVEIRGLFRLEPIAKVDAKMINYLGLVDLDAMGNIEVDLYNNLTQAGKKGPIQGLYEFGIFSTFLSGSEVPNWFSNKSIESSISLTVPSLDLKIGGLNRCGIHLLYDKEEKVTESSIGEEAIGISTNPSSQNVIGADLSAYLTSVGLFLLCHYDCMMRRKCLSDAWDPYDYESTGLGSFSFDQ